MCYHADDPVTNLQQVDEYENDGVKLLQALHKIESDDQVMMILGSLEGPYVVLTEMKIFTYTVNYRYAFVFYHVGLSYADRITHLIILSRQVLSPFISVAIRSVEDLF